MQIEKSGLKYSSLFLPNKFLSRKIDPSFERNIINGKGLTVTKDGCVYLSSCKFLINKSISVSLSYPDRGMSLVIGILNSIFINSSGHVPVLTFDTLRGVNSIRLHKLNEILQIAYSSNPRVLSPALYSLKNLLLTHKKLKHISFSSDIIPLKNRYEVKRYKP